jgi:hypothetical protein
MMERLIADGLTDGSLRALLLSRDHRNASHIWTHIARQVLVAGDAAMEKALSQSQGVPLFCSATRRILPCGYPP